MAFGAFFFSHLLALAAMRASNAFSSEWERRSLVLLFSGCDVFFMVVSLSGLFSHRQILDVFRLLLLGNALIADSTKPALLSGLLA